MSIFTRIFGAVQRQFRSESWRESSILDPDDDLLEAFGGGKSASGMRVNRKTALTYSAIWRGVRLISADVAKLPIFVYDKSGDTLTRATKHPAYRLLKIKPNPEMTAFTWKQTIVAHAILQGNSYTHIERNGIGEPIALWPLLPDRTWPIRVNGELMYTTRLDSGEWRKIKKEDILHIKNLGYDGLIGYSMLEKARESIGLGLATARYTSRFFRNNANPSILIEVPGTMPPEAQREFLRQWEKMHAGVDNAHRPAIITNGGSAKPFSISAKDAQLLESRQFEIREIANWIGVPPHKLGDSSRTAYNSLEQENESYLSESLDPWMVAIEEECETKLIDERDLLEEKKDIEFKRGAFLRADIRSRYQAYSLGINNRFLRPNEVRQMENLNPYEGGDEILIPLNMGNPGGNPQAKPSEAAPAKGTEKDSARAASIRAVAEDACTRAINRFAFHARRSAEKPATFINSIDELRTQTAAATSILLPAAGLFSENLAAAKTLASRAVGEFVDAFHAELLAASECKESELSKRVADVADLHSSFGAGWLANVLDGTIEHYRLDEGRQPEGEKGNDRTQIHESGEGDDSNAGG